MTQREEIRFFSKKSSHRQIFIQEIKDALREIKESWGLSSTPIHCILSSDFALLRVTTFEKPSRFASISRLVQRDAQQFLPLPLEQVCIAYQKIGRTKYDGSKIVAYAAMRTDFLEAIAESIQGAGFSIQKMSLLPLSLHASLKIFKKTLLIDLAEQRVSFLFSSEKNLCQACFHPLGKNSDGLREEERGLPLLLFSYLKREIPTLIDSMGFPELCWSIKAHAPERRLTQLSLFLKKEFSIAAIDIDPCVLLNSVNDSVFASTFNFKSYKPELSWKHFLGGKNRRISPIEKFTAPSIQKFQIKQRAVLLIYVLSFLILLVSPLSLVRDYFENKEIAKEALAASITLKQRNLELKQLRRDIEKLKMAEDVEKKLKELQAAHDSWPLLICELQKSAPPRGMWITQLTPVIKEIKGSKSLSEISSLEIKGLYLEGMNGEGLVGEYADRLANSPLFLRSKKESFILSCSKEDGTAHAYPFSLKLPLCSPIRQSI